MIQPQEASSGVFASSGGIQAVVAGEDSVTDVPEPPFRHYRLHPHFLFIHRGLVAFALPPVFPFASTIRLLAIDTVTNTPGLLGIVDASQRRGSLSGFEISSWNMNRELSSRLSRSPRRVRNREDSSSSRDGLSIQEEPEANDGGMQFARRITKSLAWREKCIDEDSFFFCISFFMYSIARILFREDQRASNNKRGVV